MKAPLVVFDLDGTLIDTAPDLIASVNHTIESLHLAPLAFEELNYIIGNGAKAMIERSCALRDHALDPDAMPALLERFITFYGQGMPGDSKPYPGLVAAMERLQAAGYKLAVCTNKTEQLALNLLRKLDLERHFAAITGGNTFPVRKPDAEHILGTIRLADGDPKRSIMIGDSINDILAARNAGIPSIAVPFGYSDVDVATLDPNHVISHFDELTPELVERLLARG